MCGLAGVAGLGIRSSHLIALRQLLYLTALRGEDSTGVAGIYSHHIPKHEEYKIFKELGHSYDFTKKDFRKKDSLLWDSSNDIIMGHCRDATIGSVTVANAHPFDTKNLIGAHNGTLKHKDFALDPVKTDSQMMFEAMSDEGIVPVLNSLTGGCAYAISVYQKNSETLTLARNSKRTLFIGVCDRDDVMFWSSEQIMLEFISERCNIPMHIYTLKPWVVYSFNVSLIKKGSKNWEMEEIEEKKETKGGTSSSYPFQSWSWYPEEDENEEKEVTRTPDNDVPWDETDQANLWDDLRTCATCPCCERPTNLLVVSKRGMMVCESCDTYLQYNT